MGLILTLLDNYIMCQKYAGHGGAVVAPSKVEQIS
jgi:hypothetical protein